MMYHIRESTPLSKSFIWSPSLPDILLRSLWFSPTIRPHCPTPRTVLTIAYNPLRTRSNSNGHDFEVDFEYEPEPGGVRTEGTTCARQGARWDRSTEAPAAERGIRSSGDAGREATVCTKRAPSLSPAATAVPAARPPPITSPPPCPPYCTRRTLAQHLYGTVSLSRWPR